MDRAIAFKAVPFEVIAGSPHTNYGARLTFRAPQSAAARESLEIALGLPAHPWGLSEWLGLRVSRKGATDWKRYHAIGCVPLSFHNLSGVSDALVPVMASLHAERIEVYYRLTARVPWDSFAASCSQLVGAEAPDTAIHPSSRPDAFCASVSWDGDCIDTVTIFADDRALPDEQTISARWREELPEGDREPYDAAFAAVRALGSRPARGWHAMLSWSFSRRADASRAVSLRLSPARLLG